MSRNIVTHSVKPSGRQQSDMERYLKNYAKLTPSSAATFLIQFASGTRFVCPDVSASLSEQDQWNGHSARADLIAEHGLFASYADAVRDKHKADAPKIAERRKALSEGFLDYGATASIRADELAADLSISVAQARATLKAEQPKSTIPSVEERSKGMPDMGGDMNDVFSGSAKSQSSKMSAAIDRAAGVKEGNLK